MLRLEKPDERTEQEREQEWREFLEWVEENDGIPEDPELPFN